jgi:hypothetical protein
MSSEKKIEADKRHEAPGLMKPKREESQLYGGEVEDYGNDAVKTPQASPKVERVQRKRTKGKV